MMGSFVFDRYRWQVNNSSLARVPVSGSGLFRLCEAQGDVTAIGDVVRFDQSSVRAHDILARRAVYVTPAYCRPLLIFVE